MFRPRILSVQSYLILTFAYVSFAAVTPQRLSSFTSTNNITKFVQHSPQKLPSIPKTPKNQRLNLSHAFLAHFAGLGLHSFDPSRAPAYGNLRSALASTQQQSTQLQVSSRQLGLNYDSCVSDSECAGLRFCLTRTGRGYLGNCVGSSDPGCFCRQLDAPDSYCTSNSDCDDGESCIEAGSILVCFSDNAGSTNRDDDSSSSGSSSPGSGLNGETCKTNSDCTLPRQCLDGQFRSQPQFCRSAVCKCYSTNPGDLFCTSDSNCAFGESCIGVESTSGKICFSDNVIESSNSGNTSGSSSSGPDSGSPNSSSTEEDPPNSVPISNDGPTEVNPSAVCIGSDSLTHLPKKDLVFEHDALAHVLCDANESCATPGHMVVYKGEALMMNSYCARVGCTRKVKRVNSPKYVRRLTVPSETRDLVFTAFAARFGTVAEEGVLSVAVRVGL